MPVPAITPETYGTLDDAYRFFNTRLWGGVLPALLITLQRRRGAGGSFAPERFSERPGSTICDVRPVRSVHELTLNPDAFTGRSDRDIVSILVHEMVHTWQQERGRPSRRGYHNRQWAAEMTRIGLHPSSTGEPGGREVGQRMGHYVATDGLFVTLWEQLSSTGFVLRWESAELSAALKRTRTSQRSSKTRYRCPRCGANAWAKPRASLVCGRCSRSPTLVSYVAPGSAGEDVAGSSG